MTQTEFNLWVPIVAALGGVLIGSLAPIVIGVLNAGAETRRERLRLAVQLAIEDHRHLRASAVAAARLSGREPGVSPIAAVFAYHAAVLETFQKKKKVTPTELAKLYREAEATYDAMIEAQEASDAAAASRATPP